MIEVRAAGDVGDVPASDVQLPWLVARLTDIPWPAKQWIAERPLAWRYYTAACRRAGWNGACLGWHTPHNGPFAGIRTRALHANHLWVPVGVYEVGVSECLMAVLREQAAGAGGTDVWDVGANHGRLSLLCARHGASRVLAIEPSASNIAILNEHLAANPGISARIDVLQAAIADEDGEVEFVMNDLDGAVGQIRSREVAGYDHGSAASIGSVASWRLDTLRATRRAPALVKIDVEGAEVLVLRGAARLLDIDRPIVLVEIHNADAGRASLALLRDAGYRCERLDAGAHRVAPRADPRILVVEHERHVEAALEDRSEERGIGRIDRDEHGVEALAFEQAGGGPPQAGERAQTQIADAGTTGPASRPCRRPHHAKARRHEREQPGIEPSLVAR